MIRCKCGYSSNPNSICCTECGRPFQKNRLAITSMWTVIVAILLIAVPVLGLLLLLVGVFIAVLGIISSYKIKTGFSQSVASLVLGALLLLPTFIINIGYLVTNIENKQKQSAEVQALEGYNISDSSSPSELSEFITKCQSSNAIDLDEYPAIKLNYDKALKLQKDIELKDSFLQELGFVMQIELDNVTSDSSEEELRKYHKSVCAIIDKSEKYQDMLDQNSLQTIQDLQEKLTNVLTEIDEKRSKAAESRKKYLLSRISKEYNEFDDYYWYKHKSYPPYVNSRSYVQVYFQVTNGSPHNLRLRLNYKSKDWVFSEIYKIKTDITSYEFIGRSVHDVCYGSIVEWIDFSVEPSDEPILLDMGQSNITKIRYQGDHRYDDRTVSSEDKTAILEVLELYHILK